MKLNATSFCLDPVLIQFESVVKYLRSKAFLLSIPLCDDCDHMIGVMGVKGKS